MFSSIKPKLDNHLFVGFGGFNNSYLILPVANLKLFWKSKQKNLGLQPVKTPKPTNKWSSSFGLIEENMELSRIN